MKTVSDCSLCLLKLAHTSAKAMGADEPARMKAVKAALRVLVDDDFSRIPPAIARDVLDAVNAALGNPDPFREVKLEHDQKARELSDAWAPGYLGAAKSPRDRLERALRVALAGNGMDVATVDDARPEVFEHWVKAPWAVYDFDEFQKALDAAPAVLYLCDNAGEIAFDRFLIKELLDRGKRVTVALKAGPALNDATLDDARAAGLYEVTGRAGKPEIITTGQATMGTDLAAIGDEFGRRFREAPLILAKGQANLESLHQCGREVFFLTLVKCGHVADHFRLAKGSAMLYRGGRP